MYAGISQGTKKKINLLYYKYHLKHLKDFVTNKIVFWIFI